MTKLFDSYMLSDMTDVFSPETAHYDNAVDTLAASKVMRDLATKLHDERGPGEFDPRIGRAESNAKEGVQRAVVLAGLAQADELEAINRTLAVGLDGISQRLADLVELFTEALESNDDVDVDCTRCDGPIALSTFQANDGLCEACKQHVDKEIDALAVSGPHEGEDRA